MTTTERRGSAYPPALLDLLPQARALAERLGELPSRNRLMKELRIGAGKATALLDALATPGVTASVVPRPVLRTVPALVDSDTVPLSNATPARPALMDPMPSVPAAGSDAVAIGDLAAVSSEPAPAGRRVASWPVLLLALPAFVAIWSGWVGLGGLTGFGVVRPLPGIWDSLAVNTAITLPIGMEAYAAYALRVWLSGSTPLRARRFARWSAVGALVLGGAGQVAYHLMSAAGVTAAPWPITAVVACLPVAVLGMGAALAHLLTESESESGSVLGVREVQR